MDYSHITDKLFKEIDNSEISGKLHKINAKLSEYDNIDVYKSCFGFMDITSLSATDSSNSVREFAEKVFNFKRHFAAVPNVASICVYPTFVDVIGLTLGDSEIAITSVGGGFPSSQTFIEVKMLECAMAEESGADEIDIVMNLGQFRDGNYNIVANEIEIIRKELDDDTTLKVILESGILTSLTEVRKAAVLAMAGGADIIKTSTGKNGPGATPEAFIVMCEAVQDYYNATGERVGVKVAGGVSSVADAVLYYAIVSEILGEEWLSSEFFRIGASSLANNLLSAITGEKVIYF